MLHCLDTHSVAIETVAMPYANNIPIVSVLYKYTDRFTEWDEHVHGMLRNMQCARCL